MNKRVEAMGKIREAAKLLEEAGCIEDLSTLAFKESDLFQGFNGSIGGDPIDDQEYFNCAVCGEGHVLGISTIRMLAPVDLNHQYGLSFRFEQSYRDCSFWSRIWEGLGILRKIVVKKEIEDEILIDREDVTRLRDLFRRMERD